MDPISIIVAALVAGAAAAGKDAAAEAVKDAYQGFKKLIMRKFGARPEVALAVEQVEQHPNSQGWPAALQEGLQQAQADKDPEVMEQAQKLWDLLKSLGLSGGTSYQATLTGSGAIAQGAGAVAAGAGGTAIGGSVQGGVHIGGSGKASGEADSNVANKG